MRPRRTLSGFARSTASTLLLCRSSTKRPADFGTGMLSCERSRTNERHPSVKDLDFYDTALLAAAQHLYPLFESDATVAKKAADFAEELLAERNRRLSLRPKINCDLPEPNK